MTGENGQAWGQGDAHGSTSLELWDAYTSLVPKSGTESGTKTYTRILIQPSIRKYVLLSKSSILVGDLTVHEYPSICVLREYSLPAIASSFHIHPNLSADALSSPHYDVSPLSRTRAPSSSADARLNEIPIGNRCHNQWPGQGLTFSMFLP
jgi:hypothetical protein